MTGLFHVRGAGEIIGRDGRDDRVHRSGRLDGRGDLVHLSDRLGRRDRGL